MKKSKWGEYSYTIWLGISFCVIAYIWQFGGLKNYRPDEVKEYFADVVKSLEDSLFLQETTYAVSNDVARNLPMAGSVRYEDGSATVEGVLQTGLTEMVNVTTEEEAEETEETEEKVREIYQADISYFDDALFIGDSRTVGLYEYGGLGNAEVLANSGMSIYKIYKQEFKLRSGETVTLEEALQMRKFGKVYIMLGINELGYSFDQTVERFGEAIARIRQLQPDAIIFIQANLHVSKEKSDQSDIVNNENINRYNEAISQFADGEQIFYLDANPMYDDKDGALSTQFSTDHAHILGKYYVGWADYILRNAVK